MFQRFLSYFVLLLFITSSCQKELYFDTVPFVFHCDSVTATGIYTQGMPITGNNKIDISINVISPGPYNFHTDTVNGISFFATGRTYDTGPQVISLAAIGKPLNPGQFSYRADGLSCNLILKVVADTGTASYSFTGVPGYCTSPVISGNYVSGVTLDSALNTVTLQVNVTSPGSYIISTQGNGMTFSARGNFPNTGSGQTVVLEGTGTPVSAGDFDLLAGATATCAFTISVSVNPATGPDYLSCMLEGQLFIFNRGLAGTYTFMPGNPFVLGASGSEFPFGDKHLSISFINTSSSVTTGVYQNINSANSQLGIAVQFSDELVRSYSTSPVINNSFTGKLDTLTTHLATGSFFGTLYFSGAGPEIIHVTEGKFSFHY